jgi:hypothetical protein
VPISRFVGPNIFALKGGGYGCLFSLTGLDEEALTDLELEARVRQVDGALRGLPEGSCLYQYTRVMSGFDLPRQKQYGVEAFDDRLIAVDEFHHVSSNPDNKLGLHLSQFIARSRVHLVAMTGSYFRGDAEAVLTPLEEAKFDRRDRVDVRRAKSASSLALRRFSALWMNMDTLRNMGKNTRSLSGYMRCGSTVCVRLGSAVPCSPHSIIRDCSPVLRSPSLLRPRR